LGLGDPEATLWTVGIEEGGTWCTDDKSEEYVLLHLRNRIRKFTEEIIPVDAGDSNNFRVAHVAAKISCGISRCCNDWRGNWKWYQECKLWKEGSKTCNINIYPLGKDSLKSSFPKCYRKLFGVDNWENYKKIVEEQRFKRIWDFYREKQPQAIICYGKSHWSEFEKIFELDKEKSEEYVDKSTKIYPEKRVILTRHFSNGFRDDICEFIVEKLKEWDVEIP
jgi:hypothetical protein